MIRWCVTNSQSLISKKSLKIKLPSQGAITAFIMPADYHAITDH